MANINENRKLMVENMKKVRTQLSESFGFGELPSDKLMKMKVSAKDMLASVGKNKVNESLTQKISGINFEIGRSPVGLMFKFKNPSEFRKSNINVNDLVNTITKMLDSKFGKGSYTYMPSGRLQDDPTVNGLEFGVNISKLF
jgi:cell fate (sporulation/competence/biofilm development) regulator YmcA (YheA/YmcA/DUF963 family)